MDAEGNIDLTTMPRADVTPQSLASHLLSVGDLVISRSGTCGIAGVFPGHDIPVVPGAFLIRFRLDDPELAPYFRRYFNSTVGRPRLDRLAVGGVQKNITGSAVLALDVPVPPLAEQRRINKILDTVDGAIRKTEEIIAKLKQVKQGLLHDLLTRGIDENGELRDPDRHPEQFQDSPLGRIPKAWEVGALERWLVGRPKNGYSPPAVEEWTGMVMLGLGCLTSEGFTPAQLKNAPVGDPQLAKATLEPGDLLVSRANTRDLVGLVGRFQPVGLPCTYPDLMMRLTPAASVSAAFLELVLRSSPVRRQMQAMASGTSSSMVKISGAIVCGLRVAMPGEREQERIVDAVGAAESRLNRELADKAKLADLKRGLMEDLLTGRVRVTALLEEAAE